MKDYIKIRSSIKVKIIDIILFSIVFISIFGWGYKVGKNIYNEKDIDRIDIFFLILLLSIFYFSIRYINTIRRIIITTNKVKIYTIFNPFGKEYFFKNYKAKYITEEYGTEGSYEVMYLVDEQGFTTLKIYGLHYENMEEIIKSINLPIIKKNLSFREYIRLLFTGKIKIM